MELRTKDQIREEHLYLMEQVMEGTISESEFHHLKDELYKFWKDAEGE